MLYALIIWVQMSYAGGIVNVGYYKTEATCQIAADGFMKRHPHTTLGYYYNFDCTPVEGKA